MKPSELWTDQISSTYCPARFQQISVNPDVLKNTSCCHFGYEEQTYSQDFKVLAEKERLSRQMMLEGQKPSECKKCWDIEKAGGDSSRKKWARLLTPSTEALANNSDFFQIDQKLKWLNLRMGRTCRMKCLYCSPEFSEAWEMELRRNGPFFEGPNHHTHFQNFDVALNERDLMYEKLFQNIGQFRKIDLTGGEPLLSPYLPKFFDALEKTEYPHKLSLYILSGMGVSEKAWQDFRGRLLKLKDRQDIQVFFVVSVEAFGIRAEYIRQGLQFESLQRRILELESFQHVLLTLTMSHSCLSVGGLYEFLSWSIDLKKRFASQGSRPPMLLSSFVQKPHILNAQIFGPAFAESVQVALSEFNIFEETLFRLNETRGLLSVPKWLAEAPQMVASDVQLLKEFLEKCDQRLSKSSWQKVFPELLPYF